MKEGFQVSGEDDAEDDRKMGEVDEGARGGRWGGRRRQQRRRGGGADSLLEGERDVAEGGVATDNGEAKDGREGSGLEK